ncbi:MAG: type II toxin-antitoxin system VapC family toxin [Planctomycetia bacterium]|nr:type II toxin-antitoxin system VapC family toxin [Planctomycetia bacterium]
MSISNTDLLVLDTNILVHWVRQDLTGVFLKDNYALDKRMERPLFSTISEGEIRGLVKTWKWGDAKKKALDELLSELVRLEAGLSEVVLAYADLYFEDQRQGKNTGQNDLWIAASARATNSVLMTCDDDFLWMSPSLVRVEHIPQVK